MLVRARLPPEVLALAYNILTALNCRSLPEGSFYSAPSDLMVVSCLSLAVSYTNDRPVDSSYWSKYVCDCMWTGVRIHKTALMILEALDWRIHPLTAPGSLERAMADLRRSRVSLDDIEVQTRRDSLLDMHQEGLDLPSKIRIVPEYSTTFGTDRRLTPGQSPAAVDDFGRHCGSEAL